MKKLVNFFFVCVLFFCFNINFVRAEESFDVTSDNILLYNLNDKDVIYEKKSDEKVQIASLTKIMTAIVAIENIDNLDEEVLVTSKVFKGMEEYAQAGLRVGNMVTYRDLLYGIMLPSGADAVNALVYGISDEYQDFVKLMNDKAKELELSNTKFDNPIGMDSENNYSTAGDLAKLLLYALENETFKTIFTTREYTIKSNNLKMQSTLVGYSKKLDVSNILGAKSGFTDGAGLCLASIATLSDVDYLLIVLGSDTDNRSNAVKDTLEIYDYYDLNYGYKTVISDNQILKKIDVKWGKEKTYDILSNDTIKLYLKNDVDIEDIEYIYDGVDEINYKYKKGDKLGVVTVKYDGRELVNYDVYLNDNLSYHHPVLYAVMAISVIAMILSFLQIKKQKKKKRKKGKNKSRRYVKNK